MKSVSLCALVWTKLSNPVLTRTGSEGVSVLTFYLLELVLAVRVEGSKEQAVPSPVTPTSPIPDTTPHHINWSARQIPLFFLFFFFLKCSLQACVCTFLHVRLCTSACVSLVPVFAMWGGKISSVLPGQTFPVSKHWRARDTTVSWRAWVHIRTCTHGQHKHNLCPSCWLTFSLVLCHACR